MAAPQGELSLANAEESRGKRTAKTVPVPELCRYHVDTFGTETASVDAIEDQVKKEFDFSPRAITKHLGLRQPGIKYLPTAKNGHFGNLAFPWESVQAAERLKMVAGVR